MSEQEHTAESGLPPRLNEIATMTGTVRTVETLFPDGHYRVTLDVDLTPPPPPEPGSPLNPVDGTEHPCPTPGYGGGHVAVGAGAISPPYRCHGCGTWFVLPCEATYVTAPVMTTEAPND